MSPRCLDSMRALNLAAASPLAPGGHRSSLHAGGSSHPTEDPLAPSPAAVTGAMQAPAWVRASGGALPVTSMSTVSGGGAGEGAAAPAPSAAWLPLNHPDAAAQREAAARSAYDTALQLQQQASSAAHAAAQRKWGAESAAAAPALAQTVACSWAAHEVAPPSTAPSWAAGKGAPYRAPSPAHRDPSAPHSAARPSASPSPPSPPLAPVDEEDLFLPERKHSPADSGTPRGSAADALAAAAPSAHAFGRAQESLPCNEVGPGLRDGRAAA